MSKIKVMDEILANKIAAGEVVEKTMNVVKELVENSIDAQSDEIKIELIDSGVKEIKVTDNGIGMDREDASLAFSRHATSKLKNLDDLFNIESLGFRGEALPSIASVSNIELKTSNGEIGTYLTLSGGKDMHVEDSNLQPGTTITVKDLFYNTPVRLKYLKNLYTELANITEYVTVNFDAVIVAVNALGGVEINIDSEELKYINSYIDATSSSSGVSSTHITKTGTQTLDGVQAVAYSRIRYTSGGDYKRTERMRTVIEAMMKKAKTLSISKLNSFADTILPRISTNISAGEILALIPSIASFDIKESLGWPYETKGITLDRWYGVPVTLESNVKKLHQEAFKQEDYEVSETVKNISDQIINKTGYSD